MPDKFTINLSQFDWQAVSAIASVFLVVLNVALVTTIWLGYRSIKESILTRDSNLLLWAIGRMAEIKDDLYMIRKAPSYGHLSTTIAANFVSPWSAEVEDAAYRISVELQRLAYLANAGLISKVHLQKMWGPTFTEAWDLLETWVKRHRFIKGEPIEISEGAFSRNDFESFAIETKKA